VVVLFNSLFLCWLLLKPGPQTIFGRGDDVGQALGWLLATLLGLVGFTWPWRRTLPAADSASALGTTTSSGQRWVPLLLCIGIFCQFIGRVISIFYDLHHWEPFPSWAGAVSLSTFPFLLLGILLLPTRSLPANTHSRVTLDGFMIVTTFATVSWYFVLGPDILHGQASVFAKIVGSASPLLDLVLICCVFRLLFRADTAVPRLAVLLLSLGLLIIVMADSRYFAQILHLSSLHGWQDEEWPLGYMLIGLAAQVVNGWLSQQQPSSPRAGQGEGATDADWQVSSYGSMLLPYGLLGAVGALAFYVWQTGTNPTLVHGVYLGAVVLIGQLLLRQYFLIREALFYNTTLRRTQHALHQNNEVLSLVNKRLEEQSAQLAEAYEQQRSLNEIKDQFLLNVNHELRTPLTEMQGYLELLNEHAGKIDTQMQATFLAHALHGCEELHHLIDTVLDALRGNLRHSPPRTQVLAVAPVVEEVLHLFGPQTRQDYQMVLDVADHLTVIADRGYLHRVLLNLLSNAFKYSPKGATVSISAQPYHPRFQEHTATESLCICVKDTGPGIPPAESALLFSRFVRLHRDVAGSIRGTGLGLFICKQLVETLGGQIWVESAGMAGEGSRFCFTLPTAPHVSAQER
jgi:signal transduction histidine kinase